MAFHWKRKSLSKGYASVTFASSSDHHQTGLQQLRRKKCDEVSLLLPITSSMHEGKYLQCYSNTSPLPELTTETNDESEHQLSSSNCRRHLLPSTPIPTRKKNIKIHRHHPQHHQQQIRKKSLELYPLPLISEDEEELEEEDEVSAISSTTSSSVSPPSSSACSAAPTSCTTSDSISNYEDSPAAAAASGATAKFTAIHLGSRNAPGIWGVQNIRQPVDDMLMATNSSSTLENPTSAGTSINRNQSHPFKRRGKQWHKRPVRIEVTSFGLRLSDEKRVIDGLICLSDGGDDADTSIADDDNNGDFRNGSSRFYTIKDISYGVQDPRHPSVFAFITVVEGDLRVVQHPFRCHALLCESPDHARRLTLALAAAFDEHGGRMRNSNAVDDEGAGGGKRLGDLFLVRRLANELKLAIDLRSPDEILAELLAGLKVTEESEA